MKLLQETENATSDRKFIKSQVEKRRRERMNRSLERLRSILLQGPKPPVGSRHRVEKAEILENTVVFLQETAKGDQRRSAAGGGGDGRGGGDGGDGGQKHSFQDGFSSCLQTAARFLGPEGRGLLLGSALDASLAARSSRPDSDPSGAQRRPEAHPSSSSSSSSASSSSSGSLPDAKSILRLLRQKSKSELRLHTRPFGGPVQQRFPRILQQAQRQSQLEIRGASKQSPTQSGEPACQTLWRPWP